MELTGHDQSASEKDTNTIYKGAQAQCVGSVLEALVPTALSQAGAFITESHAYEDHRFSKSLTAQTEAYSVLQFISSVVLNCLNSGLIEVSTIAFFRYTSAFPPCCLGHSCSVRWILNSTHLCPVQTATVSQT